MRLQLRTVILFFLTLIAPNLVVAQAPPPPPPSDFPEPMAPDGKRKPAKKKSHRQVDEGDREGVKPPLPVVPPTPEPTLPDEPEL